MLKNGRPTDITLIKIDKVTKNSISGAKFSLLRGSENVDLTDSALTITAINDGATVTPEDYDFNGTTIKVVTVPEGGIKIAGLVDGTYTLKEVTAPAGYIITDSGKTFKTENGAIKNTDDTAHDDEATDIAFEVENEPGAALPNTGGPGTNLIYLFGLLLTSFAGTGILMKRRRRNAA
jgi:LPXTG-motif cell wall-anchored protein